MNTLTRVQILDETVSISHNANALGKGMNPTIPSTAMGESVEQIGLFNLARQPV